MSPTLQKVTMAVLEVVRNAYNYLLVKVNDV